MVEFSGCMKRAIDAFGVSLGFGNLQRRSVSGEPQGEGPMMQVEFARMRRRGGIMFGWQSQREPGGNRKRNCRHGLMKSHGASCCRCFRGADSTCVCAAS